MKRKFFNTLVILSILPLMQGCILAGLGALGAGGYYVGTKAGKREDERIKTQALIDVKKELSEKDKIAAEQDQGIANTIGQNYLAGQLSSGIAVYPEVRNGVVILHGRVPDTATAERAIAAARKTPGVQRIISNLVILNQQPQQMQQARSVAGIPGQQVPPEYQQQYQQMIEQYQQQYQQQQMQGVQGYPQLQYRQPEAQPQPIQLQPQVMPEQQMIPEQPKRIRYEQIFNYNKPQNTHAAKAAGLKSAQVAAKPLGKQQQKQAPPKQANVNNAIKAVPAISKTSQNSSPKLLPEKKIEYYSDDNDSGYKQYHPRRINRTAAATAKPAALQQNKVIFVPVPVPAYTEDNDDLYRGVGSYNPNPITYGGGINNTDTTPVNNIPVPTPADDEDYDGNGYI